MFFHPVTTGLLLLTVFICGALSQQQSTTSSSFQSTTGQDSGEATSTGNADEVTTDGMVWAFGNNMGGHGHQGDFPLQCDQHKDAQNNNAADCDLLLSSLTDLIMLNETGGMNSAPYEGEAGRIQTCCGLFRIEAVTVKCCQQLNDLCFDVDTDRHKCNYGMGDNGNYPDNMVMPYPEGEGNTDGMWHEVVDFFKKGVSWMKNAFGME